MPVPTYFVCPQLLCMSPPSLSVPTYRVTQKKTQEFSLITRTVVVYELYHEIINRLFLKKTEIHTQILNTEPFLCSSRGQRYLTNKMVL